MASDAEDGGASTTTPANEATAASKKNTKKPAKKPAKKPVSELDRALNNITVDTPSDPSCPSLPLYATSDDPRAQKLKQARIAAARTSNPEGVLITGVVEQVRQKFHVMAGYIGLEDSAALVDILQQDYWDQGPIKDLMDAAAAKFSTSWWNEGSQNAGFQFIVDVLTRKVTTIDGTSVNDEWFADSTLPLGLTDAERASKKKAAFRSTRPSFAIVLGLYHILVYYQDLFRYTEQRLKEPEDERTLRKTGYKKFLCGYVMEDWHAAWCLWRFASYTLRKNPELYVMKKKNKGKGKAKNVDSADADADDEEDETVEPEGADADEDADMAAGTDTAGKAKTRAKTKKVRKGTVQHKYAIIPYFMTDKDDRSIVTIEDDYATDLRDLPDAEKEKAYLPKPFVAVDRRNMTQTERLKHKELELQKHMDLVGAIAKCDDKGRPKQPSSKEVANTEMPLLDHKARAHVMRLIANFANPAWPSTDDINNLLNLEPPGDLSEITVDLATNEKSRNDFNPDPQMGMLIQGGVASTGTSKLAELVKSHGQIEGLRETLARTSERTTTDDDRTAAAEDDLIEGAVFKGGMETSYNRILSATNTNTDMTPSYQDSIHILATLFQGDEAFADFTIDKPMIGERQLRPWQVTGIVWLLCMVNRVGFGCLCDDVGLGKSLTVLVTLAAWVRLWKYKITHNERLPSNVWPIEGPRFTIDALASSLPDPSEHEFKPTVISCPASAWVTWRQEISRVPGLSPRVFYGTDNVAGMQSAGQDAVSFLLTCAELSRKDPNTAGVVILTTITTWRVRTMLTLSKKDFEDYEDRLNEMLRRAGASEDVAAPASDVRDALQSLARDLAKQDLKSVKRNHRVIMGLDEEEEYASLEIEANSSREIVSLVPLTVGIFIVDEAHLIRNPRTQSCLAITKLEPQAIVLCTGTLCWSKLIDVLGPLSLLDKQMKLRGVKRVYADTELTPTDLKNRYDEMATAQHKVFNVDVHDLYKHGYLEYELFRVLFANEDQVSLLDVTHALPLLLSTLTIRRTKGGIQETGDGRAVVIGSEICSPVVRTIDLTMNVDQAKMYEEFHETLAERLVRGAATLPSDGKPTVVGTGPASGAESGGARDMNAHRCLINLSHTPLAGKLTACKALVADTNDWALMPNHGYTIYYDHHKPHPFAKPHRDRAQAVRELCEFSQELCMIASLLDSVVETRKSKVILFCPSTYIQYSVELMVSLLYGRDSFYHIRSSDDAESRLESVRKWSEPEDPVKIFIISTRCASSSLNLQKCCRHMFIVGPPWSTNEAIQLIGRIVRIGQTGIPIIFILTTRYTYQDFMRYQAEERYLPVLVSSTNLDLDEAQIAGIVAETAAVFVHPEEDSIAQVLIAESYYRILVGQPVTTRFWMHLIDIWRKSELTGLGHPNLEASRMYQKKTGSMLAKYDGNDKHLAAIKKMELLAAARKLGLQLSDEINVDSSAAGPSTPADPASSDPLSSRKRRSDDPKFASHLKRARIHRGHHSSDDNSIVPVSDIIGRLSISHRNPNETDNDSNGEDNEEDDIRRAEVEDPDPSDLDNSDKTDRESPLSDLDALEERLKSSAKKKERAMLRAAMHRLKRDEHESEDDRDSDSERSEGEPGDDLDSAGKRSEGESEDDLDTAGKRLKDTDDMDIDDDTAPAAKGSSSTVVEPTASRRELRKRTRPNYAA